MMKKIAVIGGGITGLMVAYRLGQKGYPVTVIEKEKNLGGLLGGFKIGKTEIEKTYHHIFRTDKYAVDLIEELGLGSRLKWHEEKTAIFYDGQMYPFMGAIDLLKFKPLKLVDKLRLGLVKIFLEKDNNWRKYEGITAVEWMRKWCGKRAYKVIWEPLLRGKFHHYYDKVSMAWMWARIHTRTNSGGKLGYLDGGFGQIIDELAKRIKQNGGEILLNKEMDQKKLGSGFDMIVHTEPIDSVNYLGSVVLLFTSKQNLSRYYWHNINDLQSPFLAMIQHTNLVDKKDYGNRHVYYLGTYGEAEQKIDGWFDYLKKIFPKFDKKLVEEWQVFRFKYAQQVVTTNYKVKDYQEGKNSYRVNFAQIYPEDRGINYAIREAEKVVALILKGR